MVRAPSHTKSFPLLYRLLSLVLQYQAELQLPRTVQFPHILLMRGKYDFQLDYCPVFLVGLRKNGQEVSHTLKLLG